VIESFPEGAIARRGPHKAIFSNDLNVPAVFDIASSDGKRLAGGVRALQLTDFATGQTVVLGKVKESAPGKLLPPNQVLFQDGLEGVQADILYTWRHNFFAQDVILRQRVALPEGFATASTRLEIVTEFVAAPGAEGTAIQRDESGADDLFVRFGRLAIVPGNVFLNEEGNALALGAFNPFQSGKHVAKNWHRTEDGRVFLLESIGWNEIAPEVEKLQLRASKDSPKRPRATAPTQLAGGAKKGLRHWPDPVHGTLPRKAMEMAQLQEPLRGLVLDFVILPDTSVTWFQNGTTYYVKTYFAATSFQFDAGCVVKYKNAAYLLCYSTVTMPSSGEALFTSRNDDLFGQKITGVSGETDSDGDPTLHLADAQISFYYPPGNTEVKYGRFRWAKHGLQYSVGTSYTIQSAHDCKFEHIFATGSSAIYLSAMPSTMLTLSSSKKCNVATTFSGSSNHTGSLTDDCGVVNASYDASDTGTPRRAAGNQGEPSIAVRVNPNHSSKMQIVVVSIWHTGSPGLLRMISNDSGATWSTAVIADGNDSLPRSEPDSDPSVAFDKFGNLFLIYRSSPNGTDHNTALLVSSNGGSTWTSVKTFTGADGGMPKVATTHSGSQSTSGSVWVSYIKGNGVYPRGTEVTGFGSSNISSTWTPETAIRSTDCQNSFSSLAIGPNNEVLMCYAIGGGISHNTAPVTNYFHIDADGVLSGGFQSAGAVSNINLGWEELTAVFGATPYPVLGWDWTHDKIYFVCGDRPSGASGDETDIYLRYPTSRGTSWSWSSPQRVNDDTGPGTRTQFHPWVVVDQSSGKVAVCWYDSRDDSANAKVSLYATVSTDYFGTAPPRNFRVTSGQSEQNGYGEFKEYIGAAFFQGYFFPVWTDNSNSIGNNPDGTNHQMDLYTARIPY
jgi:hypothetical protein